MARTTRTRTVLLAAAVLLAGGAVPQVTAAPRSTDCAGGNFPDLQTVVPKHLQIQNQQQREILRFTNGIANRGAGDWRMRPDPPPGTDTLLTNAVQEILRSDGTIACERVVSSFAYHPAHNHWHIGDVALFEVRAALDDGTGEAWEPSS
jgi:hypothetical protein